MIKYHVTTSGGNQKPERALDASRCLQQQQPPPPARGPPSGRLGSFSPSLPRLEKLSGGGAYSTWNRIGNDQWSLQQVINDYKVVIFYLLVDAPIRSTVVLDRKLIVLQRTLSSQL